MTFQHMLHYPFTISSCSFDTYEDQSVDYRHQNSHQKLVGYSNMSAPIRPHENDVLMGRGGKNNQHSGNEKLRGMARLEGENYRKSSKKGKSYISRQLVQQVRSLDPPGRFLKRDNETGDWEDVGDDVAREKASQVLRDAVALLPDENNDDPLPVAPSTSQPTSYPSAVASVPVSVDETERAQSMYSRRTTPMLAHHSSELPVPTPVTSFRKRQRHQYYYGYEGYPPEEGVHSPIPSPSRRRHYYQPPAPASIHSSASRRVHSRGYYGMYCNPEPLVPTLPLSNTEFSRQHHHHQTNRPPAVSARQASTASAQSLLGELQSGMTEFDLFNGELIDSDQEEEQKRNRAPPRHDL